MAGNTRGKLKERFEGVHRNFEWIKLHLAHALILIHEHKPKLSDSIKGLADEIDTLDKLAQDIYSKL